MGSRGKKEDVQFLVNMMDPNILEPHIQNWRKHDKRQREAYHAFREQLGPELWLLPVIYNTRTGHLLDGHMRVEEAIKSGEKFVPVRCIDVDEETEKLILASLDPIGDLAKSDNAAYEALATDARKRLGKIKTKANKTLQQLLKDATGHAFGVKRTPSVRVAVEDDTPDATRENGSYEPSEALSTLSETIINNNIKFPSSNPWELPDLLPDMLATPEDAPRDTWTKGIASDQVLYYCHGGRPWTNPSPESGVLGFYTDDWRFESIYAEADIFIEALKEEPWRAIIAPDFSAYEGWPFPEQLFNIYKSRWCARLWQEIGFKVIPSLEDIGPRTNEIIYSTLKGSPVVAIQARNASSNERIITQLKEATKAIKPAAIVVYGGADKAKYIRPYLSRRCEYIFLPDTIRARKKNRRSPKSIADDVSDD